MSETDPKPSESEGDREEKKEKKKKKSKDKDKDRDKEKEVSMPTPVKEVEKEPEPEVIKEKATTTTAPALSTGKKKMRAQRATSNVFAMFGQTQIQEFKEAFTMIDQDRDGFISKEDLKDMYASLGKDARDKDLEEMLSEAPGPINFTMFLTLFGDKLSGTDTEDVIRNAFKIIDEKGEGKIKEAVMKDYLTGMGERMTHDEVSDLLKNAPFTEAGLYDYAKLAHLITHGSDEA
ncbi:unnamed protein product [Gordionus sp. m RMFG-2023]|uniref:myosin regulatory light chain 12B-like n=1 Tax=Gordionus sp. m RMFG-2023 TaxID=3053472 RepID=UPI0030E0A627